MTSHLLPAKVDAGLIRGIDPGCFQNDHRNGRTVLSRWLKGWARGIRKQFRIVRPAQKSVLTNTGSARIIPCFGSLGTRFPCADADYPRVGFISTTNTSSWPREVPPGRMLPPGSFSGWRSSVVEQLICNQQVGGSNPFASLDV